MNSMNKQKKTTRNFRYRYTKIKRNFFIYRSKRISRQVKVNGTKKYDVFISVSTKSDEDNLFFNFFPSFPEDKNTKNKTEFVIGTKNDKQNDRLIEHENKMETQEFYLLLFDLDYDFPREKILKSSKEEKYEELQDIIYKMSLTLENVLASDIICHKIKYTVLVSTRKSI